MLYTTLRQLFPDNNVVPRFIIGLSLLDCSAYHRGLDCRDLVFRVRSNVDSSVEAGFARIRHSLDHLVKDKQQTDRQNNAQREHMIDESL
jgi:hypothetical protein